jgi:hypothetical protein
MSTTSAAHSSHNPHDQWHQSGSQMSGSSSHHAGASAADSRPQTGTYQQFNEPLRDGREDKNQREICGIPGWMVNMYYRVRNALSIYSFFWIYCLNALLNLEIYREYMDTHGGATAAYHRTMFENLYIATLFAPLVDVIVRILARNAYKLNLAKSQSHVGVTASLAICTPSLNSYAILMLHRYAKTIFFVMFLDMVEICYSIYMWTLQPVKSEALWIKLFFLGLTSIFFIWDSVVLFEYRRFFRGLPPHMHPIFICWDVNREFHWSSPNSIFSVMETHEDLHSVKFTAPEYTAVRKRIAQWNEGEEAIGMIGEDEARRPAGAAAGRREHDSEDEHDGDRGRRDSDAEAQSLIDGARAGNGRR